MNKPDNTSREELRNKVERLVGTAILKNDKNYTDDFMQLFDTALQAQADKMLTAHKEAERNTWHQAENYGRMNEHHIISHDLFDNEDLAAMRPILVRRLKKRRDQLQEQSDNLTAERRQAIKEQLNGGESNA